MNPPGWRRTATVFVFSCAVVLCSAHSADCPGFRATTRAAADGERRTKLGSFRFALRDLPALLAPAPPIYAYLKNGQNENPYDDLLRPGSVVGIVERLEAAGPRDTPERLATYTLVLVAGGNPVSRHYVLVAEKFQVRLLFPETSLTEPGPKPTVAALRRAFGRHIVFPGGKSSSSR